MSSEVKTVEYWETENLPSMDKNSPEFHATMEASLKEDSLKSMFNHPYLPKEVIADGQLKRIKSLVNTAFEKTIFYKEKYTQAGFHPNDLNTWDDYHALPLTTKDELIEAFPNKCVNSDYDFAELFPTRSSGSSGKTLLIRVDPQAIITDTLQGLRQFELQTGGNYNPTDTIAHVYTVPWWVDHFGDDSYQNFFVSSLIEPKKIATILDEVKPDILSLYPSNLASLIPHLSEGVKSNLRAVVTHSEMSSKQERAAYAKALGTMVLDEYSSEEMTRIALELPDGNYYLCEDTVRLDIIDQLTQRPIKQGTGIAVGTNLLNEAMPFIRYVQGDFVTIGAQRPSLLNWRQIEKVNGRANDSFIREDGSEVPAGTILDMTYRWMFDIGVNIQEFSVVQKSPTEIVITAFEPKLNNNHELEVKSLHHFEELARYVIGENVRVTLNLQENSEGPQPNNKKRRPIRKEF
jgi:phenylacetate-CoA ligase